MNPNDVVRSIYTKDRREIQAEEYFPYYFSKVFSQDPDCANALNQILEYCFYISAQHYYYLMYFFIPKKFNYNIKDIKKLEEADEDKLLIKIKYVLGWSNKELKTNKKLIDTEFLSNREYWEQELGVAKTKTRKSK